MLSRITVFSLIFFTSVNFSFSVHAQYSRPDGGPSEWAAHPDENGAGRAGWTTEEQGNSRGKTFFELGFGKVPAEELYDKRNDVDMAKNLADNPEYQDKLRELRSKLEGYLAAHDDPRMKGLSPWDDYNLDKPFPISQPKNEE